MTATKNASSLSTFTLPRTGQPPLKFTGSIIAETSGEIVNGHEQLRYHDIGIYRTVAGKYVTEINYYSSWRNETGYDDVAIWDSTSEVAAALRNYDPVCYVQGWPPGKQFDDRQRRLLVDLRSRFNRQVSEVLAREEFAEFLE